MAILQVSSTANQGSAHLICVYTADFSKLEEIRTVYGRLQQALPAVRLAGYKPDVYTLLEINSKNRWRLEPTIYTPRQLQTQQQADVSDNDFKAIGTADAAQ